MSKTIFVQVPAPKPATKTSPAEEARVCPIHANDNPHGGHMMLAPADGPLEVMDSATIRRRIRSGDLVAVDAPKKSAKEG